MTAIIEVNCAQPLPEFEWETAQYDAYVFGVDVVESISTGDRLRKLDVRRRRFLTLRKDADPDIPILKQATAEYAKQQ
jgi:hypothetical protein